MSDQPLDKYNPPQHHTSSHKSSYPVKVLLSDNHNLYIFESLIINSLHKARNGLKMQILFHRNLYFRGGGEGIRIPGWSPRRTLHHLSYRLVDEVLGGLEPRHLGDGCTRPR